ncbi:MAG: asparagine synthase (glutamine-hydrolyzing) [Candidatus Dojkabacteria bacterium]|nr:asparagine synthase (glutamine-hydrolyzing) [Candidatus Dojkabacteria bacterium]
MKGLGHKFKTKSDSETIVHGYEEWGYDVVKELRGMFVFVLYDKLQGNLFIARDRLGIKPLYYAIHDNRFIFGSEIKTLFSGFNIDRSPNEKSVYKFLASRVHDDTEETFFKNVKRLMPGHYAVLKTVKEGELPSIDIQKYWEPTFNSEFKSRKSDDDYAKEFKDIFSEALKLHLVADVPVGLTLSGGLDSSGIASLSMKLFDEALTLDQTADSKPEVIAFSAIHPGESIDESEYIDSVVNATGIKPVKIQPNVETFWDELEDWTYYQEEPVISGAPYAYYVVMREARKQVTVLLSGQGGDELLAGYIPYFKTYAQSALDQKQYFSLIRETFKGRDLYFPFIKKLLESKFKKKGGFNVNDMLTGNNYDFKIGNYSRNLNERLFNDVTVSTTPALLRYEDKNSMAHSLESRVPFFDHKVVEYIFNLPIDQKIKFGWNRWIYRNTMKGIIPDKNRLRRSKVGFTNPEWEWIERKKDKFIEIFSSTSFRSRSFWNVDKVLEEFDKAINGGKDYDSDILFFWRLFIVEMWMRSLRR